MSIRPIKTNNYTIQAWREKYIESLPEPQELFLEMKVRKSEAYLLMYEKHDAGYCMMGKDSDLTEFYLNPEFLPVAESIFEELLRQLTIEIIWCISFDRLLLSLCLEKHLTYEVMGFSFRQRINTPISNLPAGIKVRMATDSDIDLIWEKDDTFFESREEIAEVIKQDMLLYFFKSGEFIGIGTIMHIIPGSNVYDVGMLVNPAHRKKGIGVALVNYLADYCTQKNWRPNFGCAVENIASRRTLEKAGFVTRDRLLLFKLEG